MRNQEICTTGRIRPKGRDVSSTHDRVRSMIAQNTLICGLERGQYAMDITDDGYRHVWLRHGDKDIPLDGIRRILAQPESGEG